MKKIQSFALIPAATLVLVLSAVGATSCGGSHDPGYVPDMTVDTAGTTIKFWTGFGTNVNSTINPLLEEFTEQTGITVQYEPKGGYANLQSAVNLAATSGEYPNLVNGYPDHFVGYVTSNIISRLDGYIEADRNIPLLTESQTGELLTAADPINQHMNYEDFYADYRRENEQIEFDADGKGYVLGVPFNKSTEVGTYNKTMLGMLQHFDGTIKLPETYAEIASEGAKIMEVLNDIGLWNKVIGKNYVVYADSAAATSAGTSVLLDFSAVDQAHFKVMSYNSTDNWFITGVRQWGGTYTDKDMATGRGYVAFDNEYTRTFLSDLEDLFNDGYLGIPATWEESLYCSGPFTLNKTMINISSSAGVYASVPAGDTFEVGVCAVPYKDAEHAYVISQGTNLCLLDKGTDAERVASWKLLRFLSQEMNADFVIGTGYYPTGVSVANSDTYQAYLNSTRTKSSDKLQIAAAKLNTEVYNGPNSIWQFFVDAPFNGSSYIRATVATIIGTLFYGDDKDIDHIIANILATLSDYVR